MNEEPEQTPVSQEAAPAPAEAPAAKETAQKESAPRQRNVGGIVLDSALVLLLIGMLGGGCWYMNHELSQMHVPSPMEVAMQKNEELCQKRDELQRKANHADEQLHMRRRLSALVQQQMELQRTIAEKRSAVEAAHRQVLAVQHDIRQADKTSRNVAKGLLPGLFIGDVTTSKGKVYENATIHRLEGNNISLRMPTGLTRFPLRELVKDNLPDLARYAFGLDDLVDMTDFEVKAGESKPKPRKGKLITPAKPAPTPSAAPELADYESGGAPIVETDADKGATLSGADTDIPTGAERPIDTWEPPTGDLPI